MPIIDPNIPAHPLFGDDEDGASRANKNKLNPDDFIKLFLAQMQHQNPMHPADSSVILQQMAEISSINAADTMQKSMKAMEKNVEIMLGKTQMLEASQLINHKVVIPSEVNQYVEKEGMKGSVVLKQAATAITVTIKDNAGHIVKTIKLPGTPNAGLVDYAWTDGKDDAGKDVKPDYYHVTATATVNGQENAIYSCGAFKVNSVAQQNGTVILNVDGLGGTNLNDIIKIL